MTKRPPSARNLRTDTRKDSSTKSAGGQVNPALQAGERNNFACIKNFLTNTENKDSTQLAITSSQMNPHQQ